MAIRLRHWRVLYYASWLVPVIVASFANYTVSLDSNPDATWLRYFQIHFFYWMAWGVIGEFAYKGTPQRLYLRPQPLGAFVSRHALMIGGVVAYFAVYYWIINQSQFAAADSLKSLLELMLTRSGPVMFHVMNVVTYLIVLGVCLVLRQSRYAREQEEQRMQLQLLSQTLEARLSESKLAALINQIHPHFLFNAMNNIASLISGGNNKEAYEAVTLLGVLLRKTFHYVNQPTIALKDETDFVTTMLKIGKLRFDERLSWTINLPEELSGVPVPPFLIQPLAENALRHAVEAQSTPVHILVDIQAVADDLTVTVHDNGPGAAAIATAAGVGLQNLRERLALMSNGAASLEISTPADGGFQVVIRLPLRAARG